MHPHNSTPNNRNANRNVEPVTVLALGRGELSADRLASLFNRAAWLTADRRPHFHHSASLKLSASVSLRLQGAVVRAAGVAPSSLADRRGDRRAIYEFSSKSRRAMIERILVIEPAALRSAFWVRLSYHDSVAPENGQVVKRHLDNFSKRFRRRFPAAWALWKEEFERRKSGELIGSLLPHFHLLIGGVDGDEVDLLVWLVKAWGGVIGCSHPDFLAHGVHVVRTYGDLRRLTGYVSKYMGKEVAADVLEEFGWFGRVWGTIAKKNIPLAAERHALLKGSEVVEFNRLVRSWLRRRGPSGRRYARHLARRQLGLGCLLFGISSDEARRLVDHAIALAARPHRVVIDLASMTETRQSRWVDGDGRPLDAAAVSLYSGGPAARVWGAPVRSLPPSMMGDGG